jgi:hypothetical protein
MTLPRGLDRTLIDYASIAFRFLRQPSRPNAPRPEAILRAAVVVCRQLGVTEQECTDNGNVWLSRKANPTRTVASFVCNYVTRPKVFHRHTDRYQE